MTVRSHAAEIKRSAPLTSQKIRLVSRSKKNERPSALPSGAAGRVRRADWLRRLRVDQSGSKSVRTKATAMVRLRIGEVDTGIRKTKKNRRPTSSTLTKRSFLLTNGRGWETFFFFFFFFFSFGFFPSRRELAAGRPALKITAPFIRRVRPSPFYFDGAVGNATTGFTTTSSCRTSTLTAFYAVPQRLVPAGN